MNKISVDGFFSSIIYASEGLMCEPQFFVLTIFAGETNENRNVSSWQAFFLKRRRTTDTKHSWNFISSQKVSKHKHTQRTKFLTSICNPSYSSSFLLILLFSHSILTTFSNIIVLHRVSLLNRKIKSVLCLMFSLHVIRFYFAIIV